MVAKLAIVYSDFCSRWLAWKQIWQIFSLTFFSFLLSLLLFTHFVDTQEAEILFALIFWHNLAYVFLLFKASIRKLYSLEYYFLSFRGPAFGRGRLDHSIPWILNIKFQRYNIIQWKSL